MNWPQDIRTTLQQECAQGESVPVAIALDQDDLAQAREVALQLIGVTKWFKVGCRLLANHGYRAVKEIASLGAHVFLDLKVNGLPRTDRAIGEAVVELVELGVALVDIHISAGPDALKKFVEGFGARSRPAVVGVTQLTSAPAENRAAREAAVLRLAKVAQDAGLNGVVASAHEVRALKSMFGEEFLVVTPGIRPEGSARNEQLHVATPKAAIEAGADLLVVGRPVTGARSPVAVLREMAEEIREVYCHQAQPIRPAVRGALEERQHNDDGRSVSFLSAH